MKQKIESQKKYMKRILKNKNNLIESFDVYKGKIVNDTSFNLLKLAVEVIFDSGVRYGKEEAKLKRMVEWEKLKKE